MLAAQFYLPLSVSIEDKTELVTNIITELGLIKVIHTPIGGEKKRGVSGGERWGHNTSCLFLICFPVQKAVQYRAAVNIQSSDSLPGWAHFRPWCFSGSVCHGEHEANVTKWLAIRQFFCLCIHSSQVVWWSRSFISPVPASLICLIDCSFCPEEGSLHLTLTIAPLLIRVLKHFSYVCWLCRTMFMGKAIDGVQWFSQNGYCSSCWNVMITSNHLWNYNLYSILTNGCNCIHLLPFVVC